MNYLKHLTDISDDIENIGITLSSYFTPVPKVCGTCSKFYVLPDIEIQTVNIEIKNPKNFEHLNKLLDMNKFKFNDSSYTSHNFIRTNKLYDVYVKYALYKKPGFDDILAALKKLKPDITEYQLAFAFDTECEECADKDLVTERVYEGDDDNCIRNDDGSVYTFEMADLNTYKFECINVIIPLKDIELNFDLLTNIILTQK